MVDLKRTIKGFPQPPSMILAFSKHMKKLSSQFFGFDIEKRHRRGTLAQFEPSLGQNFR
jgi:hypothetical protein